jgi:hypothetical protein
MKRRGAEHVYSTIKDMTPEQELEYWRKRTEEMRQEQLAAKRKAGSAAPPQTGEQAR